MGDPITNAMLIEAGGISASYASMILAGQRQPSRPLAIRVFLKTGHRIGPLVGLSDQEIAVLTAIEAKRPDISDAVRGRRTGGGLNA